MKIRDKYSEAYIDLPTTGEYEVCSSERIDLRPSEEREVETDLEVLANKDDEVLLYGNMAESERIYGRSYEDLTVTMKNTTDNLIPIYPGDKIAVLSYKVRQATLSTTAVFTEEEPEENATD